MKIRKYLAWLLVFSFVFSLVTANTAQAMVKSTQATVIKSISLKIGKKEVTKKTCKMKQGEKKKLKVTVSPQKGKKTIKFTTSNKKVAAISKNGTVTAKQAGTAEIKVVVKAGKTQKAAWMKIKVTKTSDTDKDTAITEQPQNPVVNRKSIVVYFSCTDNTKTIAEYIKASTASDIYRIEPSVPYTSEDLNYGNADSRTSKEQNDATARPEMAGDLPNLSDYGVVYLGYPIWWGQAPKIMYTFVEHYNLSGKTVIPFCTSASSGVGTSAANLQAVDTGQATWLAGRRFSGSSPKTDVDNWILGLGLQ